MNQLIRQLLGKAKQHNKFSVDLKTGLSTRQYQSYEEYLLHQRGKLANVLNELRPADLEYEEVVYERYLHRQDDWEGKRVICLAARLGGEVRAFKKLGALAVGLDIEPGTENQHVLHGDFHSIQFPDNCFDIAFTNAIDHVLDLQRFMHEVARVLTLQGRFFIELADVPPSAYEVIDTVNLAAIRTHIEKYFTILHEEPITNRTSYASWSGTMFSLQCNKAN